MSASKLKVRGAGWKQYHHARLQISVGQSYHEGEALRHTLTWASNNFHHVTICVNDTLQRYNHAYAEEAGREWIERNLPLIRELLPRYRIRRWNEWLNNVDFQPYHDEMKRFYRWNSSFRTSVDAEAEAFWNRRNMGNKQDYLARSVDYLLEECAVFLIMFQEPAADIYPGSTLLPCKLFKKGEGVRGFTRVELRDSLSA